MPITGKFRALLATARIANVPSVVSNVWVGIAIQTFAIVEMKWDLGPAFFLRAAGLAMAGVLLYISGNFLNDWHDRACDLEKRPERALPRGLFPASLYLSLAIFLGLSGLALATAIHPWSGLTAAAILFFIAIYTRWHKRAAWPVIAMGLCRALLPVMGFVAFSNREGDTYLIFPLAIVPSALALLFYIAGLSLSAKYESAPSAAKFAPRLSRGLLVFSALLVVSGWAWLGPIVLVGILPFAIWLALSFTKYRRPISAHVSALLAGIPLLDWIGLLPLALHQFSNRPFVLACLLIPPLAFLSALFLQKIAPAT